MAALAAMLGTAAYLLTYTAPSPPLSEKAKKLLDQATDILRDYDDKHPKR